MFHVKKDSETTLSLSGDVVLEHAAELYDALRPLLDVERAVGLRLSEVRELDLAGLQVLLAFVQARGRGRTEFLGCSPGVKQVVELSGLGPWISV
jgi:anti-anti-sigma factor